VLFNSAGLYWRQPTADGVRPLGARPAGRKMATGRCGPPPWQPSGRPP